MAQTRFIKDTGLTARMTLVMFLLGALLVGFIAVLIGVFGNSPEMIVLIGRQVLAQSCRQMAEWQQRFGNAAPGVMCVNVSSKQFGDADLTSEVQSVLDETGLHPSSLKLEITESAFLGDIRRAQATLRRLKKTTTISS